MMIVGSLRKEAATMESGGICRRRDELSDFKPREIDLDNGRPKKSRGVRRRRLELRRVNSLLEEKSDVEYGSILSDHEVALKKMRSEVGKEKILIDQSPLCGVGRSRYGKIAHLGRRRHMEDAATAELGFLNKDGKCYDFYGVFDGHGGWRVASTCSQMMHKVLAKVLEDESEVEIGWGEVMEAAFKGMDEEVNKNGADAVTTGSTAVVAVVGEEEVVVANCGDSRAVICRSGVAGQLSDDHKPDRPDELERIEFCGGKVINWNGARVLGVLATSRSIGDHYLKPYVIPDPEVKIIRRTSGDEFLILASDGLWDVVSNELACKITRRCLDGRLRRTSLLFSKAMNNEIEGSQFDFKTNIENRCFEAAAVLIELAMARGSGDNVSVIVVDMSRCALSRVVESA